MSREDMSYPKDIPDVAAGLAALSQRECLVTMDELMSRRGHNPVLLSHMIRVWRSDRAAWRDARDARADKKEAEE